MSKSDWINTSQYSNGVYPQTSFNGIVVLNKQGVSDLCYLLTEKTFWENIQLLFNNPSEYITSLRVYPLQLPNYASSNIPQYLTLANLNTNIQCKDLGIITTPLGLNEQTGSYRMGDVDIPRHFNDFRDFNGYTQISVYLPYMGYVDLPANEVVGQRLHIYLVVDFYSGKGQYYLCVGPTNRPQDNRIISQYEVQIGVDIPLTSTNKNELYRNMALNGVKSLTRGLFNSIPTPTTTQMKSSHYERNPSTGRQILASRDVIESTKESQGDNTMMSSTIELGLSSLFNMSQSVQSDRNASPTIDNASTKNVKIVIKRPKTPPILQDRFNSLYGRPCGKIATLGLLRGFTIVSNIHLENFGTATEREISQINSLLKSGVIL